MTSSRSTATRSDLARTVAWLCAALVALVIVAAPGRAEARRRLVVLEFTGPKAAAFQEDVEKLLKKGNSLVPRKKWDAAADDLGATKVSEKNVKKVARKLSIDGVIIGRVEKRGSRYYLHLQLREGKTGKTVAAPDIVERSPRLGDDGRDTIRDELLPVIDDLDPAGGGDDDEEEDEADEDDDRRSGFGRKGRGKVRADEDDDEEADEDDDRAGRKGRKGGKSRDDDEEDEDDGKTARGKAARDKAARDKAARDKAARDKARADEDEDEDDEGADDDEDDDRVAARDDDRDADEDDEDRDRADGDGEDDDVGIGRVASLTDPRNRALDVAVGMSFTGRRLSFATNLQMNRPQGYRGGPVPGLYIGADIYPLAFNARRKGALRNLGVSLVFDRVLKISSNLEKMGTNYELPTTEQHYAAGVVYRHPLGAALQLEGSIRYNRRKFAIDKSNPALAPCDVDIPSTSYTYVDPGLALKYALSPKLIANADARFLLITDTGAMQLPTQYGGATVTGVDVEAGVDFELAPKILLRAAARFTTIGFAFEGNGELSNNRDGNPATVDVSGARDTYFGGFASGVYLF